MRITSLETFLVGAGMRNFCFIRLTTDKGVTGIGEATLEWQERATETLIHELFQESYVVGADPFDVEQLVMRMVRDQYQGGAVAMTAISGIEIAMWDIIGKAVGQPVYKLLGGRCHERLPAYANAWYGGAVTPDDYAEKAKAVVEAGFGGLKFDPLRTAWKRVSPEEIRRSIANVEAVRRAVGEDVELMIELHGRLAPDAALEMANRLVPYHPTWIEEPVAYEKLDRLCELKKRVQIPIAAGERIYMLADFAQLTELHAVDVVQMDVAHCGGIMMSKKVAALAEAHDIAFAPHVSIGPVALAAALHLDMCCTNFFRQEDFSQYDVDHRAALVRGWDRLARGYFTLDDTPGLGLELDEAVAAAHPYKPNRWGGLWREQWLAELTGRTSKT